MKRRGREGRGKRMGGEGEGAGIGCYQSTK